MSYNRTVYCGYCHNPGHNKRSCEQLKKYVEENPDSYTARSYNRSKEESSKRRCGYCYESGHNRKTCIDLKKDYADAAKLNVAFRERIAEFLKENGLVPGALVTANAGWQTDGESRLMMITHICWDEINFDSISDNWKSDAIVAQELSKMGGDLPMRHGHKLRIPLDQVFEGYEGAMTARVSGVLASVESPIAAELAEEQIPGWFVHREDAVKEMFKNCTRHSNLSHERNEARALMFNSNDSEGL